MTSFDFRYGKIDCTNKLSICYLLCVYVPLQNIIDLICFASYLKAYSSEFFF